MLRAGRRRTASTGRAVVRRLRRARSAITRTSPPRAATGEEDRGRWAAPVRGARRSRARRAPPAPLRPGRRRRPATGVPRPCSAACVLPPEHDRRDQVGRLRGYRLDSAANTSHWPIRRVGRVRCSEATNTVADHGRPEPSGTAAPPVRSKVTECAPEPGVVNPGAVASRPRIHAACCSSDEVAGEAPSAGAGSRSRPAADRPQRRQLVEDQEQRPGAVGDRLEEPDDGFFGRRRMVRVQREDEEHGCDDGTQRVAGRRRVVPSIRSRVARRRNSATGVIPRSSSRLLCSSLNPAARQVHCGMPPSVDPASARRRRSPCRAGTDSGGGHRVA